MVYLNKSLNISCESNNKTIMYIITKTIYLLYCLYA